jgi:hypothetical protein
MSRRGLARHNAKRDENEPKIVETLEAHGCVVWRLSGKGLPDLLVMRKRRVYLADVKMPGKRTTPAQEELWEEAATKANVAVFILRTPEDAVAMLNDALQPWEPKQPRAQVLAALKARVQARLAARKGDAAKAKEPMGMGHAIRDQDPPWLKERVQRAVDAAKEAEAFASPACACTREVPCSEHSRLDTPCRTVDCKGTARAPYAYCGECWTAAISGS